MGLALYKKISYKIFKRLTAKSSHQDHLSLAPEKAHMEIRPDAYIAYAWMNTILASACGILFIFFCFRVFPLFGFFLPSKLMIIIIPSPLIFGIIAYAITMMIPDSRVSARRKDIDNRLPYALNYIAAMASAGVTPADIFQSLAEQPIYGEVQEEAKWIHRDIKVFGMDIITALRRAGKRSPSIKLQEFLQGAITTVTSGGKLKPYFLLKADQFMRENRRMQKDFLETLGILAESYVTVVVAGPLFLIVMLSIMSMVGSGIETSKMMLYVITFLVLPICHLAFTLVIKSGSPKT